MLYKVFWGIKKFVLVLFDRMQFEDVGKRFHFIYFTFY